LVLINLDKNDKSNEGKSATIFCHQVAVCGPDVFCYFYFVKSHKIANNSATTEAWGKNKHRFGISKI
jgi:hypothetical protein